MKAKIFRSCLITCASLIPFLGHAAPVNTVVATINTGVTPAGLAITPNNAFAYVANNNNYGLPNSDTVSVLNLATNLPDQTITSTSFSQPYTVTINAAGTLAYVTNSVAADISVISIASNTVTNLITGFDGPSGFAISPIAPVAYVNNYGGPILGSGNGHTVSVVDLNTNTIVQTINVDQAPAALAMAHNGAHVYVVNYVDGNPGNGTMNVIRTSDNTVIATVHGFSGPFAISLTPDDQLAYVTNFGSNNFYPFGTTVSAVDLNTNTIIGTIGVGIQPAGVDITPDGKYAYATNYNTLYTSTSFSSLVAGQGTVNIIDIATNTVLPPTIAVDQSPANIAIAPSGQFAYVTNYSSNTANVIALPTFVINGQGCKIQNIFINQVETVNKLTWSASGISLPVRYDIYRDAGLTDLAATILATDPLEFFDYNRLPSVTYTYYIVGTNAAGTTSDPLAITVTQNC